MHLSHLRYRCDMFFLSSLFTQLSKSDRNSCLSYHNIVRAVQCGLHNKITSLDHKLLLPADHQCVQFVSSCLWAILCIYYILQAQKPVIM